MFVMKINFSVPLTIGEQVILSYIDAVLSILFEFLLYVFVVCNGCMCVRKREKLCACVKQGLKLVEARIVLSGVVVRVWVPVRVGLDSGLSD